MSKKYEALVIFSKAVRDDDIRFAFVRVGTSRTIDKWFLYICH